MRTPMLAALLTFAACGGDQGTAPPPPPPPTPTNSVAFPRRAFGYDLKIYGVGRLYAIDSALYGGSDTVVYAGVDSTFTGGPARIVTVGDTVWGSFRLIDSTVTPVRDTVLQLYVWTPGLDTFSYSRVAGEEFLAVRPPKNPIHGFYFGMYQFWRLPLQVSIYVYDEPGVGHQDVFMRWGGPALPVSAAMTAPIARGGSLEDAVHRLVP